MSTRRGTSFCRNNPKNGNDLEARNTVANDGEVEAMATSEQLLYDSFETPLQLWTGLVGCGITDIPTAKTLSKNLFMDSYARCMKTTRQSIRATFKVLGKHKKRLRLNHSP